jgi:PAS domain S-box-containing protein
MNKYFLNEHLIKVQSYRLLSNLMNENIVTMRKHFEVNEMEQWLASFYGVSKIIELSSATEIVYVSKSFCDEFGVSPKDLLGKKLIDFYPKEIDKQSMSNLLQIVNGETFVADFLFEFDSRQTLQQAFVFPVINNSNEQKRIVLIFLERKNSVNEIKDIDYLNFSLLNKTVELEILNKQLYINKESLENFNRELMVLAKHDAIQTGDWELSIEILLEKVATVLKVTRVSFWNYNKISQSIICIAQFSNGKISKKDTQLRKIDYPIYFEAIENENVINASDVYTHANTKEFIEPYLKPLDIMSMLDVPYFLDGQLGGVLCIEQQISPKTWSAEDVLFARGVSDILTIAWKAYNRNLAEMKLIEKNIQIEKINQDLKEQQAFVYALNQELESKVEFRTLLLKRQNEKLSEYAFINAHLLRGPLCRIQGLVQVMQLNTDKKSEMDQLLIYMQQATKELDLVVHNITNHLEEGRYFDRNDIRVVSELKRNA